jgi:hypothetical protein
MVRDLIALDDSSKVWLYQADKAFSDEDVLAIRKRLFEFLNNWTSHNRDLLTYGNVFHRRFLGIFVDESQAGASGCSIDKSVHFLESLGAQFNTDFFRRDLFTYIQNDQIQEIEFSRMKSAYADNEINDETLFFDHLVKDKKSFLNSWLVPLKDSWHKRFI